MSTLTTDTNMSFRPIHLSTDMKPIEITNSKIINFYNSHPNINIDEINLYFINIIDKLSPSELRAFSPTNMVSTNFFDKTEQQSQNNFTSILSKICPAADIQTKMGTNDIYMLKRLKQSTILLKNMDIDSNIALDQITEFTDLIEKEKCCGIMLSQNSGISNKTHFQIDIKNDNIIIYIHNVNYSQSIIMSAIDIIDNLHSKIRDLSRKNGDDFTIPKELLDTINSEYQLYLVRKTELITSIKESNKKIIAQIETFAFPSLNSYLTEKCCTVVQKHSLICGLCKKYSAHNLKALAAHTRGCVRKQRSSI